MARQFPDHRWFDVTKRHARRFHHAGSGRCHMAVLVVACSRWDRAGRYNLDTLIARHGPGFGVRSCCTCWRSDPRQSGSYRHMRYRDAVPFLYRSRDGAGG